MKKHRMLWLILLVVMDCCLLVCLWIAGREEAVETSGSGIVIGGVSVSGNQAGVAKKKRIALTFDDGPNPKYTQLLLEGLKQRDVKATFFLIGQEVTEHPDIAKQIAKEGHLIGNHSFYHVDLSALSAREVEEQVGRANEVIYEATGTYPQLLRPPFGRIGKHVICEPPMREVLWTIDSRDWELSDVGTIMENVLPNAKEDAIILMHDASFSSVQAALAIIDTLKERGYIFVTVDEILYDED